MFQVLFSISMYEEFS